MGFYRKQKVTQTFGLRCQANKVLFYFLSLSLNSFTWSTVVLIISSYNEKQGAIQHVVLTKLEHLNRMNIKCH